MYCNKCSNLAARGSRFCRHCGAALDHPGAATLIPDSAYVVHSPFDPVNSEEVRQYVSEALELSEKGDATTAIGVCHKAIALDPESVSAHSLLASLYERIGDEDKAIDAYEIVVRLDPLNKLDSQRLHELYKKSGKTPTQQPSSTKAALTGDPEPQHSWPYTQTAPLVLVASLSILLIYVTHQFVPISRAAPRPRLEVESLGVPAQTVKSPELWSQYLALAVQAYNQENFERAEQYIRRAVAERPGNLKLRQYLRVVEQKVEEVRNPSSISVNEPVEPLPVPGLQPQAFPKETLSKTTISPLPGPYSMLPSPDMRRRAQLGLPDRATVVPMSNQDLAPSQVNIADPVRRNPSSRFDGFALPAPQVPRRPASPSPEGRVGRRPSRQGSSRVVPSEVRPLQRATIQVKPQVVKSLSVDEDNESKLMGDIIAPVQADDVAQPVVPRREFSVKELEKMALRALRGNKPDYDTALSRMSEALGRVRDMRRKAGIHEQIGLIYRRSSQSREAWEQLNRAAKLFEQLGADRERSRCLLAAELLLSPSR